MSISVQTRIQKLAGVLKNKQDDDVVSNVSDGIKMPKIVNTAGVSGKGTN
ncbi:MAG: hypothetical protein WC934_15245 [Acidithiobacillus sp.]|jgi:hypothetical protein